VELVGGGIGGVGDWALVTLYYGVGNRIHSEEGIKEWWVKVTIVMGLDDTT
jgi:hypothetical protein